MAAMHGDVGHIEEEALLAVVADERVAGMLARHEHAAGRGADVVAGVVVGELQALGGEAVEVGRADNFLTERAEVAVAEIVGEDKNDVGRTVRGRVGQGGEEDREEDGGGA